MDSKHKGISNFVAAVLLMGLAVAAGIVIYSYTMGYFGNLREPTIQASLSLDSVICDSSTDQLTAYIRNVGPGSVEIDAAYVNGAVVAPADLDVSSNPIVEGNVSTITIDYTDFVASTTYEIKIVGTDNTQLAFSVKAQ